VLRYLLFGLCTAPLLLQAQVHVRLPDTTLARGTLAVAPVVLALPLQRGDVLQVQLRYTRAALSIDSVAARFPQRMVTTIIADDTSGSDGVLRIRVLATGALDSAELLLHCTALWSGTSPAVLAVVDLTANGLQRAVQSQGGTLVLEPATPLKLSQEQAFGPVFPNPVDGDRINATFWLDREAAPEVALFDPLGREVGRWQLPPTPVGSHTIALPIERTATGAGVYHLWFRTDSRVFIAPCVVGK